ncbi:MAG: hypothetical protein EA401_03780 [Planctomycetota bacterium]|nr:MAG: hypothetical protein EA401_03780 [Planctomycetota bacterium]
MMRISSTSWSLLLDESWQDCSEDDLIRLLEPTSQTVLAISSSRLSDPAYQGVLITRNKDTLVEHHFTYEVQQLDSGGCALLGSDATSVLAYVHHHCTVLMITMSSQLVPGPELLAVCRSMIERLEISA